MPADALRPPLNSCTLARLAREMRIRDFNESDRVACLAVFDSNVPTHFLASEREAFAKFLLAPMGRFYVLENDRREIVGCGGWYVDGVVAGLSWGMVDRKEHGRGHGRYLLQERLRAIREDGRARTARVRTTPSVQGFFERQRFKVAGGGVMGVVPEVSLVELTLAL